MKLIVELTNNSGTKFKPYKLEARMNGKLLYSGCFHSSKLAMKYGQKHFPGIDITEALNNKKAEAAAAIAFYENF